MQRVFSIPPELENKIDSSLQKHFGLSLKNPKPLAETVQKLSDYFITKPEGSTPWKENWAQIAYLVYFLPLNQLRAQAVVHEARRQGFFKDLEDVIDFGAGLGTASLALQSDFAHFTLVEQAKEICSSYGFLNAQKMTWLEKIDTLARPEKSLTVFSYSLTELQDLPSWAKKSEALMILEPSTQQDGRKLMTLRQRLIAEGFNLWAPCTHQGVCPLLTQSKTDWCHDRIHFAMPEWFEAIEQFLPMKNRTLTMSYLLLRKSQPPHLQKGTARTVGDHMIEKGKSRQLICRGEEREFLAWMHKHGKAQEIPRGALIQIPEGSQKISNEIRVQDFIEIAK